VLRVRLCVYEYSNVSFMLVLTTITACACTCLRMLLRQYRAQPRVKRLTADDIASGKYTIFDVVAPVPGFGTVYPTHSCGKQLIDAMVSADGLDPAEAWSQLKHRCACAAHALACIVLFIITWALRTPRHLCPTGEWLAACLSGKWH
jgi:hypothetical protein